MLVHGVHHWVRTLFAGPAAELIASRAARHPRRTLGCAQKLNVVVPAKLCGADEDGDDGVGNNNNSKGKRCVVSGRLTLGTTPAKEDGVV
jgi:hypothetical protein